MDKSVAATEDVRDATLVVPPSETLDLDEIREVVGAKNVMGTCSG